MTPQLQLPGGPAAGLAGSGKPCLLQPLQQLLHSKLSQAGLAILPQLQLPGCPGEALSLISSAAM
jgi:hypothetical protein